MPRPLTLTLLCDQHVRPSFFRYITSSIHLFLLSLSLVTITLPVDQENGHSVPPVYKNDLTDKPVGIILSYNWARIIYDAKSSLVRLFNYIQGKNEYCAKIDMTAPVITQVSPSDGPFCASSFVVSFYVPGMYQANPPPAKGLHVQKWGVTYVAVKQFGGFVSDDTIGVEAASLYSSLSGSSWATAVDQGRKADPTSVYTVAQYNSPFEYTDRVNEIWLVLSMPDTYTS